MRRWVLLRLVAVWTTPEACAKDPRPAYQMFRYDEDWSCLADSTRDDWWDRLKYIPLGRPGWFASLGGEVRERFELLDQPGFGTGPVDDNGYFLHRYLLSSDLHLGARFRVFTELQSGLEQGRNGGPRPTDRDPLDLHQAFLDWKVLRSEARSVTLRFGRQELGFGSGRLIAPAEGLNLRRSMDGVRVTFQSGKWVWNASSLRLVENRAGILDNVPDHNQSLWGAGFTVPSPFWKGANFAVYYLGLDRRNSAFEKGRGRAIRHTAGTHSWKTSRTWDYNYEAVLQWGSFLGGPIRAWALSAGYSVCSVRFAPRLGFRSDAASGDGGPNRRGLGSFDPLFPAIPVYSGPSGILGPTNLIDATPSLRLELSKRLMLTLESSTFWRESPNDGVYSPFITPIRTGGPDQPRYVATAPSGTISWQATRHVSAALIYTRFLTGDLFESAPPSRNIHYLATWIAYRF